MKTTHTIAAIVATAMLAGGASATASSLITSANIKDGTVANRDVRKGTISLNRLTPGVQALINKSSQPVKAGANGSDGRNGTSGSNGSNGSDGAAGVQGNPGAQGQNGTNGSDASVSSGNWGIVDRNTIGAADASLRSGPGNAPVGKGSLNLSVPTGSDKIAYGNEVDFAGKALSSISTLSYSVYSVGENGPGNLTNLGIEIDPTGSDATAPNYTTLVSVTDPVATNQWVSVDASAGKFYLTGAAGTASNCNQVTYCTLDQIKEAFPDATLLSVQITKGRDYAFHGAVDALRVNDTVFDFEESGVFERSA